MIIYSQRNFHNDSGIVQAQQVNNLNIILNVINLQTHQLWTVDNATF